LQEKALEFDEINQKIFNRIKTNMERAHSAPRCRYPKANGGMCRGAESSRQEVLSHMRLMRLAIDRSDP